MALTGKKFESFYVTTGSGADKVVAADLTKVSAAWDVDKAEGCVKYINDPVLGPLVFQLQQMQDEIDYLRTEIDTNKDNRIVIGSSTTVSFGDMVTIPPKGKIPASYNIVMSVVNGGVTKTVKLTLA